ncbi:MAG TPA: hypothetical protein VGI39_14840 [Polyangiaceae bacterium]|jgi:hypothetical protein
MKQALAPLLLALPIVACVACGRSKPQGARVDPMTVVTVPAKDAGGVICVSDPSFPPSLEVPEASAAAEVELKKGARELLVVSDSGRKGQALAYALPDGPSRPLRLPLDPAVNDDTEGMAWLRGHLYVLVSLGYVERFTATPAGELVRDGPAYALGAPPYVSVNVKDPPSEKPPDFEGLCLRSSPSPASRCVGYAASRAYGWLVCLIFDGDHLKVDPVRPRLALDVKKHALSDCAFGAAGGPAEGVLLVTTNIRGGSTVSRVDEETGALTPIDVEGTLNNEAIAVDRDGRLYQLADAQQGGTSPSVRASCAGW